MVDLVNQQIDTIKKGRVSKRTFLVWLISVACISVGIVTTPFISVIPFFLFFIALLRFGTEEVIALLFGLLPFANIFKLTTTSMSLFTICEIIAVVYLLSKERLKTSQLFMLVVMTAYLLSFSLDNLNILTIVKTVVGLLLISIVTSTLNKGGLVLSARLLSLSTIIMLLLSSNKTYLSYVEKYFDDLDYYIDSTGHATDTLRISGFFGDPNYCAVLIVLVLSFLCVLYYYKSLGIEFWIYAAFLVPLGFLTYSKSYFLCIVLFLVMLILFVLFPKHKCLALLSLVGVCVVIWLVVNDRIEAISMIITRFSHGNITTGRAELNEIYLRYIYDNIRVLFFGTGISADRIAGVSNNVHCLYVEVLYKLGVVGTGLYCGTLAAMLSGAKKEHVKRHFVNYLPLAFFLLMFGFLAGIVNYALPFYIIIVVSAFNYYALDEKEAEAKLV